MQGNEILKTENSLVESSDSNHAHGMQCIPFRLFIKEVVTFSVQIAYMLSFTKKTLFFIYISVIATILISQLY